MVESLPHDFVRVSNTEIAYKKDPFNLTRVQDL